LIQLSFSRFGDLSCPQSVTGKTLKKNIGELRLTNTDYAQALSPKS
jgi:hypothetical protein